MTANLPSLSDKTASTFIDNMKLPVHRWFRFSADFSAQWVETAIEKARQKGRVTLLDPFAGSGTTLLAAQKLGVECYGLEAHPFIARIAQAKLFCQTDSSAYIDRIVKVTQYAETVPGNLERYPLLIRKFFSNSALESLDKLRQGWEKFADDSPESELVWLTLISILRHVSDAGIASWQYVLPRQTKKNPLEPMSGFQKMAEGMATDMILARQTAASEAILIRADARTCEGVPDRFANLVIASPPQPNNYDYADTTRLEMCFMGEIESWGDLNSAVRQYLIRSSSQYVTRKSVNLDAVLASPELEPIRAGITEVCAKLSEERDRHPGKKNYHLMVACYFLDMAKVWLALRRTCQAPATVCFVIGDSVLYGIYIPLPEWLGELARAAGFDSIEFEKTRERTTTKHQLNLYEGRLWARG